VITVPDSVSKRRRVASLPLRSLVSQVRYQRGVERDADENSYSRIMAATGEQPTPWQLVKLGSMSKAAARRWLRKLADDSFDAYAKASAELPTVKLPSVKVATPEEKMKYGSDTGS
jgi:hypothetical protein